MSRAFSATRLYFDIPRGLNSPGYHLFCASRLHSEADSKIRQAPGLSSLTPSDFASIDQKGARAHVATAVENI
jgi:hypothetical protein